MSGYYTSTVNYTAIAQMIASANERRRTVVARAAAMQVGLDRALEEVLSAPLGSAGFRERSVVLVEQIGEAKRAVDSAQADGEGVTVPGSYAETTEGQMDALLTSIREIEERLARAEAIGEAVAREHSQMVIGDADLAEARLEYLAADEAIRVMAAPLDKWFPSQAQVARQRLSAGLGAVKSASESGEVGNAAGLRSDAEGFAGEVDSMVAEAQGLEAMHERRMYLLKGLRDVCARLGFDEVVTPEYEDGDPRSAVVLRIDTRGRGRIMFRIGLDQVIETDSKMDPKYCESEFGRLADSLVERYGIEAQMTHVADEDGPNRRTRDAKDTPLSGRSSSVE